MPGDALLSGCEHDRERVVATDRGAWRGLIQPGVAALVDKHLHRLGCESSWSAVAVLIAGSGLTVYLHLCSELTRAVHRRSRGERAE
jgi:hypothetical protein